MSGPSIFAVLALLLPCVGERLHVDEIEPPPRLESPPPLPPAPPPPLEQARVYYFDRLVRAALASDEEEMLQQLTEACGADREAANPGWLPFLEEALRRLGPPGRDGSHIDTYFACRALAQAK